MIYSCLILPDSAELHSVPTKISNFNFIKKASQNYFRKAFLILLFNLYVIRKKNTHQHLL